MKKTTSQISIAIVCVVLGFLITQQFKTLNNDEVDHDKGDIINQVEELKKQKNELETSNKELGKKLKELEDAASRDGEVGTKVKDRLNDSRMALGLVDVKGAGVSITITPKTSLFGSNIESGASLVTEDELVHIVNLLKFTKAEAISINGYRITPQTGMKNSKNYIWIGNEGQVSPEQKITIDAIGDVARLKVALNFPGGLDYGALQNYNCSVSEVKEMVISKSTQNFNIEHLKPVREEGEG